MAKKSKPLTSTELRARLGAKYPSPEWILLHEVRDSTGADGGRSADCMSMSTWPSRGILLYGFELKSSRADVKKELADPKKASALSRFCDRWYLVVGRSDLVQESEVPKTWGLIVPHGSGLRIAKEAPQRERKDWHPQFVASLLRNAYQNNLTKAEKDEAYDRGFKAGVDQKNYQAHRDAEDLRKLREKVKEFERLTGARTISDRYAYHGKFEKEANLIRAILTSGAGDYFDRLTHKVAEIETMARRVRESLVKEGHLKEIVTLDDPCPHPGRGGRHEVYVQRPEKHERKKDMKLFCRACGAKGEKK